jgi:aromatic ring-opening dioxygenase catalytic subunit (LigB family)
MAVGDPRKEPMAPVLLVSHGTTMMLGEEHNSAKYWEQCGDEALAHGIEHVVVMVSPLPTSLP